jgi:hypothetical protein
MMRESTRALLNRCNDIILHAADHVEQVPKGSALEESKATHY